MRREVTELLEHNAEHARRFESRFDDVLDAQRSLLRLQEQLALSEGTVSQHAVRLYKALGGGWHAMKEDVG